jgi:hypothetical protein
MLGNWNKHSCELERERPWGVQEPAYACNRNIVSTGVPCEWGVCRAIASSGGREWGTERGTTMSSICCARVPAPAPQPGRPNPQHQRAASVLDHPATTFPATFTGAYCAATWQTRNYDTVCPVHSSVHPRCILLCSTFFSAFFYSIRTIPLGQTRVGQTANERMKACRT